MIKEFDVGIQNNGNDYPTFKVLVRLADCEHLNL